MAKAKAKQCADDVRFENRARKAVAGLTAQLGDLCGKEKPTGYWPIDWIDLKTEATALLALAREARMHVRECTACKLASENGYTA